MNDLPLMTIPSPGDIPENARLDFPLEQKEYLIAGELKVWQGPMHEIRSPVFIKGPNGEERYLLGRTPAMTVEECMEALKGAAAAYSQGKGRWPTMSVGERISHIETFAEKMKAVREDVVKLIMWEIGKTREDSEKEFDRTMDYIRETLHALKDLDRTSARFLMEESIIGQVRRSPLGIVLCMGPYNYPLNETFATLIPALVMGNTCVFKPPKFGVLLYRPLLDAFKSLPPGVINTVYGDGETIIPPLMKTGEIDVLAFIGSSRVADTLKQLHPHPHRLRSVLGLGAKNPAIILADADLDLTVKESLLGSLSYNGQRCTALKIFFVHSSIVEEFLKRFNALVSTLKCGLPWESGVKITPLPVPGKTEYLRELVQDAEANGATVVNAGGGKSQETIFAPAVLFPVNDKMRVYHEEQFGPVVPIVPFDDLNVPIQYVYNSHYGQQLSIFGSDPNVISVLVDPLVNQVSRVNLNSQCQRGPDTFPFTGRKGSAEGTLSVSDALRAFSIRTLFAAKENPLNKRIITTIVRERKSNFVSTDFIF